MKWSDVFKGTFLIVSQSCLQIVPNMSQSCQWCLKSYPKDVSMWHGGLWGVARGRINPQYITHIFRPLPSVPALKQAVSWQFSLNVKSNEKLDMCRTALVAIEFEEGEGKFKGAVAPPSSNAGAKSSSMLFSMCFISVAHFLFSSSQFLWDNPSHPKISKDKNGTERLKCGMLFLRIKII